MREIKFRGKRIDNGEGRRSDCPLKLVRGRGIDKYGLL